MKRVLICMACAWLVPSGLAYAQPNPDEAYVQSVTFGGSGCPQGSVGISFSDDRQSFTLIFDRFIASVGPGIQITDARKNCQINVNMHVPQGFQFSIASLDYRGFVQLPEGMTAERKTIYFFAGAGGQGTSTLTFDGPVSKDYLDHDAVPFGTLVWSECGAVTPLNVNAQILIDRGSNTTERGQITTDSIDGKVRTILALKWKEC